MDRGWKNILRTKTELQSECVHGGVVLRAQIMPSMRMSLLSCAPAGTRTSPRKATVRQTLRAMLVRKTQIECITERSKCKRAHHAAVSSVRMQTSSCEFTWSRGL